MVTKFFNISTDGTLSENSNILVPSQKAVRNFIASKSIQLDYMQSIQPSSASNGDKWLNTSNNLLYTYNNNWDIGILIEKDQFFTFNDLLYYYDGSEIKNYSTLSVTEQNHGNQIKLWVGTREEYGDLDSDEIDPNTIYRISDESDAYAILATQTQFDNSSQTTAATPYQVNQKFGNYLPLSGGNLDAGAILRLTNTNSEVTALAFNTSGQLTISSDIYGTSQLDINSIVVRSGNIYKTNTSGATVLWSDSSISSTQLPTASTTDLGAVKIDGTTITINNGVISVSGSAALPSQTGQQGKYLTTDGTTASWDIPMAGLPMFYATYQPRKLNNSCWLRADPKSWHSADVYVSAYAHLADNISGVTAETETIAGTTITFYKLSDEIKVVLPDQETNLDTIYNATGIGYYFVLDTTNRQFKLPRNIYGFTGYRGDVGGYVAESLPNITGEYSDISSKPNVEPSGKGAIKATYNGYWGYSGTASRVYNGTLDFDASRSSSAYQDNAPVQQRATQAYLYFYVGNTVQNETSVDVAEMTEALNDKSDKDLGNLDSQGKQVASTMSMPSGQYDTLTLGASGTPYTAPADGYFTIAAMNTVRDGFLAFRNTTSSLYSASARNGFAGGAIQTFIMAKKGDSVVVLYDGLTDVIFRFIYTEGFKTN